MSIINAIESTKLQDSSKLKTVIIKKPADDIVKDALGSSSFKISNQNQWELMCRSFIDINFCNVVQSASFFLNAKLLSTFLSQLNL